MVSASVTGKSSLVTSRDQFTCRGDHSYRMCIPTTKKAPLVAGQVFVAEEMTTVHCGIYFIFALLLEFAGVNQILWLHFPADQHGRPRQLGRVCNVHPSEKRLTLWRDITRLRRAGYASLVGGTYVTLEPILQPTVKRPVSRHKDARQ
jgi:hypothetical protein